MPNIMTVDRIAACVAVELDEELDRIAAGEVDDILTATFDNGWSPSIPL